MGLEVRPVQGAVGRTRFVDLPFRLFGGDPGWVPPLRRSVRDRLSPRHPAASHQRVQLWMAYRDGRPVGRIGACVDELFNASQDQPWAWVGFFEAAEDTAVANALFERAWHWAADQGMPVCVGPASFTTNDEIGLLVDGRQYPPTMLTTHNPAYYERLWLDGGWTPVMDLWGWMFWLSTGPALSDRQRAVVDRLGERGDYRVRSANMRDFNAEVRRLFDIYTAAWSRNWGFAPMTQAEADHMAKELKLVVDPELAVFVDLPDGRSVGFALAVPDINQAIAHLRDGRLLPLGWLRLLRAQRQINQSRILLLGIRPEYENRAVGPVLYATLIDRMIGKGLDAEASWTLATNHRINSAIEAMGAKHYKTWRLYEHRL